MYLKEHFVVLNQGAGNFGIHTAAVLLDPIKTFGTNIMLEIYNTGDQPERVGGPEHQGEEEGGDRQADQGRPAHQRVARTVAEPASHRRQVTAEHDRPEKD